MPVRFDNLQQVNYLAHAYLSFNLPDIVVGNLISDFVKGKRKLDYPPAIQTGIALHRAIDTFTDTHPAVREAKTAFKPDYGLYSAPLTDIAFDHFLANDPLIFPFPASLSAFARQTYSHMASRSSLFPDRFSRLFPYMRDQDWLSGYRAMEGIFASFAGLARRATYMPLPDEACRLFEVHYQYIRECYTAFFPELATFALHTLSDLRT
jgi:acyl carrier protein phosphodiesterase